MSSLSTSTSSWNVSTWLPYRRQRPRGKDTDNWIGRCGKTWLATTFIAIDFRKVIGVVSAAMELKHYRSQAVPPRNSGHRFCESENSSYCFLVILLAWNKMKTKTCYISTGKTNILFTVFFSQIVLLNHSLDILKVSFNLMNAWLIGHLSKHTFTPSTRHKKNLVDQNKTHSQEIGFQKHKYLFLQPQLSRGLINRTKNVWKPTLTASGRGTTHNRDLQPNVRNKLWNLHLNHPLWLRRVLSNKVFHKTQTLNIKLF